MAHSKLKRKALAYFKQGWRPPETAEKIGAALRSVQRWHQQFLAENPELQEIKKTKVVIIALEDLQATESPQKPQAEIPHSEDEAKYQKFLELVKKGRQDFLIEREMGISREEYQKYNQRFFSELEAKRKEASEKAKPVESEDYQQFFTEMAANAQRQAFQHRVLRDRLFSALEAVLTNQDDLNYRAINALSQALCRHSQEEFKSGFMHMLEPDVAAKRIKSIGYEIVPREENDE